jgi:hypothetical protein
MNSGTPSMKLEIRVPTQNIEVLGQFDPGNFWFTREVYIDGNRCPYTLERIILAGLDTLREEHLRAIEKE